MTRRSSPAGQECERLARPRDMDAFLDDLSRAVAEVVAKHDHDPANPGGRDGRPFRVIAGVYPGPDGGGDDGDEGPGRSTDSEVVGSTNTVTHRERRCAALARRTDEQ